MGLKSKLSKMKNFLFDDEEEESTSVKKVKDKKERNKIKEEPKKNGVEKKSEFTEDFYLEDLSEDVNDTGLVKTRSSKNELDFKFPEFDDSDFMVSRPVINEKEEEKKPTYLYEPEKPKTNLYQGRRKEEVKKFKPSPIISPIYGLLDKDGNMIEKDSLDYKKVTLEKDEVTFDDVRKKAYGKIDEEIENTIKRLSKKTIEEAEKEHEKEVKNEKASRTKKMKAIKEEINEDDDIILPNINFKEIDVDNKKIINKSKHKDEDDDDDDTKEQDLFNLIDTIYNGKEKDK